MQVRQVEQPYDLVSLQKSAERNPRELEKHWEHRLFVLPIRDEALCCSEQHVEPLISCPAQLPRFQSREAEKGLAPPLRHAPLLLVEWSTVEQIEQLLLPWEKKVPELLHVQYLLDKRVHLPARHEDVPCHLAVVSG